MHLLAQPRRDRYRTIVNMNYAFAKELEKLNFPYRNEPRVAVGENGFNGEVAYIPSLSELVEACGENVGVYHLLGNTWIAGIVNLETPEGMFFDKEQRGTTPEEAVARLWLALNKK